MPVRSGSSGQTQLTDTFFYEPIFNQLCVRVERRGNPVGVSGGSDVYFSPQNPPALQPRLRRRRNSSLRSATRRTRSTITKRTPRAPWKAIPICKESWASAAIEIGSLYAFVNNQLIAAGLTGFPSNLGDINGDGTGTSPTNPAPHLGNMVKIQHPTVNLINPDPNTGLLTQPRVEVFTSNALGQTTTHTDPNGNLTVYVRYPYNDPEGNGGATAPGLSAKQYGRVKEVHIDANPNDVLSLVGSDGDLVDFIPGVIPRPNSSTPTPVYQDLVTRYEGGSRRRRQRLAPRVLTTPWAIPWP